MSTEGVFLTKSQAEALQSFINEARRGNRLQIPPQINDISQEIRQQILRGPSRPRKKKTQVGGRGVRSSNWTPECQRGGRKFLVIQAVESRGKNETIARSFMEVLMAHPEANYQHQVTGEWVAKMAHSLAGTPFPSPKPTGPIRRLARRCFYSDLKEVQANFVWMVARMQLAIAVLKLANANLKRRTITDIWRVEGNGLNGTGVTEGTWRSIYFLMIIAVCNKRHEALNLAPPVLTSLCENIRSPPQGSRFVDFVKKLSTLTNCLKTAIPIKIPEFDCTDIQVNDNFLDAVKLNDFALPPRGAGWSIQLGIPDDSSFRVSHQPEALDWDKIIERVQSGSTEDTGAPAIQVRECSPPPPLAATHCVTCVFDKSTKKNKSVPFNNRGDQAERMSWTEAERKTANENVIWPENEAVLQNRLNDQFTKSGNRKKNRWTGIKPELFEGSHLEIKGKNNDLIASIMGDLPESIRADLYEKVKAAMEVRGNSVLRVADSEADLKRGGQHFNALHFVTYYRSPPKGTGAPTNEHPRNLRKESFVNESGYARMNHSQRVPYPSKDIKAYEPEYRQLCTGLASLFDWVRDALKARHGDKYTHLEQFVDILPNQQYPPAYPYAGFVLNLNNTSTAITTF
ncbi:hypothetical protein B0H16DRAFT_1839301 [Mycena metata]|uniref:Uncharacterized protein n=1 Tax=Mycena metata TaxID=1033252 RepID=A0AAD7IWN0_9AGAR|nr:hypothetical protein B0H16DRAFT_1839301 [Mycena metata]